MTFIHTNDEFIKDGCVSFKINNIECPNNINKEICSIINTTYLPIYTTNVLLLAYEFEQLGFIVKTSTNTTKYIQWGSTFYKTYTQMVVFYKREL